MTRVFLMMKYSAVLFCLLLFAVLTMLITVVASDNFIDMLYTVSTSAVHQDLEKAPVDLDVGSDAVVC